jgi:hypothetical protein
MIEEGVEEPERDSSPHVNRTAVAEEEARSQ